MKVKLADLGQFYDLIEINSKEMETLLETVNKLCQNSSDTRENEVFTMNKKCFNSIHDKAKMLRICLLLIMNNMKDFTKLANKLGEEQEKILDNKNKQ